MASATLLSDRVAASDQAQSLRVIHALAGERNTRVQALGEGPGSGPRVSSDLCLTGLSGLEWMSPNVV